MRLKGVLHLNPLRALRRLRTLGIMRLTVVCRLKYSRAFRRLRI